MSVASFVTVSSSLSLVQIVSLLKRRGKRCLLKINELHIEHSVSSPGHVHANVCYKV